MANSGGIGTSTENEWYVVTALFTNALRTHKQTAPVFMTQKLADAVEEARKAKGAHNFMSGDRIVVTQLVAEQHYHRTRAPVVFTVQPTFIEGELRWVEEWGNDRWRDQYKSTIARADVDTPVTH